MFIRQVGVAGAMTGQNKNKQKQLGKNIQNLT